MESNHCIVLFFCDKNHTLGVISVMARTLPAHYYMYMEGGDEDVPDIQAFYAPISAQNYNPGKLAPVLDVLARFS